MIVATLLGAALCQGRGLGRLHRGRGKPRRVVDAIGFLDAVAAELRRGASLRMAVAVAAPDTRAARLAMTGQPITEMAAAIEAMVGPPSNMVRAGTLLAADSGAPSAMLFEALADRFRRVEQIARDRKAATAQARLSAAVIAAVPVLLTAGTLLLRSPAALIDSTPKRAAILAGAALQLAGVGAVALLLRGAR